MTRKQSCFIPVLISLAVTSKVSFDYNTIASYRRIGMVCSVEDGEERSSIKIQQGAIDKVTMTSGCVIKSNDTRLSISCIQTGNDVMRSVNLSYPDSSDMGTWNCSDGKSHDTVTFADFFISNLSEFQNWETTFNCIVHQECNLHLWMQIISPRAYLQSIDGNVLLTKVEQWIIIDDEWRRRIIIVSETYNYLNFMLLDVDISDAGIYYIISGDEILMASDGDEILMASDAFIITVMDYPKQPVILLGSHETESKLGLYELHCASESKRHPIFKRKQLSFTWRLNGHNLTELQPCFRLSGPILTLCMDACGLGQNDNISISCSAHEDGLQSNESEPFIISPSLVTSAGSARDTDNMDHQAERTTWTLVGACVGSFIIGIILCSLLKLLVKKRGSVFRKEHREDVRSTEVPNDTLYVNTVMMIHARPEGEVPFRNTEIPNDIMYVNTIMADTYNAVEGKVRQYEVLDHTTVRYGPNQYDALQSKRSGQNAKEDTYEDI